MKPDLLLMGETFEEWVFSQLPDFPDSSNPIETRHFRRAPGGRVITTAVAAARLGLDPCVLSALSPLAREALSREGIAYRNLLRANEEPALAVSLRTEDERRTVTYPGVNENLEDRMIESLMSGKVRARHASGMFFPKDCRKWLEALSVLRKEEVSLSWDFGWKTDFHADDAFWDLVSVLDVVFLNEREAALYSGEKSPVGALTFWREHAVRTVIRWESGECLWVSQEEEGSIGAVEPTTETRDAFNGGFLYAWITGNDLEESVKLATRVATLSARRPGALEGIPYREEVENGDSHHF
jgi:sugar/nucleoside kinase (ribokinase family)